MRRGYIPTRPTGAEVFGVAGVPSDASVPAGTTIAYDTTNKRLYRRLHDGWYSVNGDGAVGAVGLFLYPSASLYPSTSLYPGEQ